MISIIIPIYNVEKYLPDCLNSILSQTFTDWEVICVNDGSPDKCGKILTEYARKDQRIKVITQKNLGVSSARNNGLKRAKGDYFCFLDADDALHPDFLKVMLDGIEKYNVPVIGCNFKIFTDSYSPKQIPKVIPLKRYKSPLTKYLFRQMKYYAMVWGKLYHKSIFKNLCFDSGLCYGEDTHISIQILSKINDIAFVDLPLYGYRDSVNSITRSAFNSKMIDDHILSGLKWNEFFEEIGASKLIRCLIKRKAANRSFRWACIRSYKQDKKNYRQIWEKYISTFDELIQQKRFSPWDLSIKYWLPFYLWRHKHWKTLRLFGIGGK